MSTDAARSFPLLRSLGLFIVAFAAGFATILAAGVAIGAVAELGGRARLEQVLAAFKNPGSSYAQAVMLTAYAAIAALLLWRFPRITRRSLSELGLRALTKADWLAVAAASGILLVARIVMTVVLIKTNNGDHVQAGFAGFHSGGLIAAALAVGSLVVAAPFTEELLFRGVLFGALAERIAPLAAALISALVFGAIHADALLFPYLALLGFINALVYRRTGNLVAAMAVHALNNLLPAIFLVTQGT
jgi:membrane protease YdiL (CAAX protease family)